MRQNNQQNSSNTQPTPPSTGNNAKLDTKALAAQIAELDPTKIDPKHQELLTALQQVLVKPTQPISSNAANQQTNQTQK